MSGSACVLGSGKMGRGIGLYLLQRGWSVTWLAEDCEHVADIEKPVGRAARRLARHCGMDEGDLTARCCLYDEIEGPPPDVVIETVSESVEAKRAALEAVSFDLSDALVLTNSSSILPSAIHERCVGMHFFFPVELTGFVEIVIPDGCPDDRKDRAIGFAESLDLKKMVQSEAGAFAANRLLLPMQAEAFRLTAAGEPPFAIDEASAAAILPAGQFALIDEIGLDVVHASVLNYVSRMPHAVRVEYAPLIDGLAERIAAGRLGKKNGSGILIGAAPGGDGLPPVVDDDAGLRETFAALFVNTCLRFLETGDIDAASLDTITGHVFRTDAPLSALLKETPLAVHLETLSARFDATGLSYFEPAGLLKRLAETGGEAA